MSEDTSIFDGRTPGLSLVSNSESLVTLLKWSSTSAFETFRCSPSHCASAWQRLWLELASGPITDFSPRKIYETSLGPSSFARLAAVLSRQAVAHNFSSTARSCQVSYSLSWPIFDVPYFL